MTTEKTESAEVILLDEADFEEVTDLQGDRFIAYSKRVPNGTYQFETRAAWPINAGMNAFQTDGKSAILSSVVVSVVSYGSDTKRKVFRLIFSVKGASGSVHIGLRWLDR